MKKSENLFTRFVGRMKCRAGYHKPKAHEPLKYWREDGPYYSTVIPVFCERCGCSEADMFMMSPDAGNLFLEVIDLKVEGRKKWDGKVDMSKLGHR